METQKKRVEKWDILKFGLIFLVVLGHFADQYVDTSNMAKMIFIYVYSFHMPLFIFVSGLFSKKNISEKRYKNIFSFFTLYLFIKIVDMISRVIISGEITFSMLNEGGAPWYALAICIYSLATILFRKISPKYVLVFSVVLAAVVGYDNDIATKFSLARIITFYPFFYAGYVLKQQKVADFLSKKPFKIASAIILLTAALIVIFKINSIYWLRPLLTSARSYSKLQEARIYGGLDRLAYYAVAFLMGSAVISLTPNKLGNGTIAKLGSRSIQVYALHYTVIYLLYGFISSKSYIAVHSWVIFPFALVTTLFFSMKFFEPFFNTILKPKGLDKND